MPLIFDSHSHYCDSRFDPDRDSVLSSLGEKGVGYVMSVSNDMKSCFVNIQLSKKYSFVFASAGIHPLDCVNQKEPYIDSLRALFAKNKNLLAVGEIGLDYHYETSPKPMQKAFFEQQLCLANELDKPVILHSREATGDMMEILRAYRPKGIMHCFSSSAETAKEILDMGLYIGFTGAVTFKNNLKAKRSAAYVPLDRLLIETDCPYMAPVPFRGNRCDSSMLFETARVLAEIKGVTTDKIIEATFENAVKAYRAEEFI